MRAIRFKLNFIKKWNTTQESWTELRAIPLRLFAANYYGIARK